MEYTDLTRNTPLSFVTTDAYFNSNGDIQASGNSVVAVDSVSLNQQQLVSIKDANGAHMYYQNDYASWPAQQEWRIYGANGIPAFTWSGDVKTPAADLSMIPEKLSKSLVRSFSINGVANITRGSALIHSSEGSGHNVSVILREGSNEVCFPEEQLNLVSSGKATIQIVLENTTIKTFNNKNFTFSKEVRLVKSITLEP